MAEYLELEKVLDDKNIITVQTKEYGSIDVIPVDTITDIELSDVQPVKRGRWLRNHEWCYHKGYTSSSYASPYWCSECNNSAKYKSDFCPNCGARMTKESEQNET